MSLIPRWRSLFPSPKKGSDFFNFGKFFEDFENNLENLNQSGLSVSNDEKCIYIEAHVPGLTSKDVEVTIDNNNVLWIKGQKKVEEKDKEKKFYLQSQSAFSYCVPLWEEIDTSAEPEAICKDGIMKVTFCKKKEKQIESKKIQVKD
jgi:HSP20 family protein